MQTQRSSRAPLIAVLGLLALFLWAPAAHATGDQHDPKAPGIALEKTGAAHGYAGDTVTYGFAVTNTGELTLTAPAVQDEKCIAAPVRAADEEDMTFDPEDVWNYTCAYVVPSDTPEVENTAGVCAAPKYGHRRRGAGASRRRGGARDEQPEVCATDTHTFPVRTIAIDVTKAAVESTATAGTTVNFVVTVSNTGNTAYAQYTFDDPNCVETRTGANAADEVFDPGETWTYGCAQATVAGQDKADNTATATGTNTDGKSATDSASASIPLTQPTVTTPSEPTPTSPAPTGTTPPGTVETPTGAILPETASSGRAGLNGPSGCVKQAFNASVKGRGIASVTFYLDGKPIKRIGGQRSSYKLKLTPEKYGFGRHRIVARVEFTAASATEAARLPLTFRRCAKAVVTPRFAG